MRPKEEKLLKSIASRLDIASLERRASNPVEVPYYLNLLESAAKGLDVVSIATFDWKLLAIAKMLKSWISDKKDEVQRQTHQNNWGYNSEAQPEVDDSMNSWDNTYY